MRRTIHRIGAGEKSRAGSPAVLLPQRRSRHVWWTMLVALLSLLGAAAGLDARFDGRAVRTGQDKAARTCHSPVAGRIDGGCKREFMLVPGRARG